MLVAIRIVVDLNFQMGLASYRPNVAWSQAKYVSMMNFFWTNTMIRNEQITWCLSKGGFAPEMVLPLAILQDDGLVVSQLDPFAHFNNLLIL